VPFWDVSGNGWITEFDMKLVVDAINGRPPANTTSLQWRVYLATKQNSSLNTLLLATIDSQRSVSYQPTVETQSDPNRYYILELRLTDGDRVGIASSEFEVYTDCSDGKDNDGDSLIDRDDPACRSSFDDPNSYDPARNDEAANFGKANSTAPDKTISSARPTYRWVSLGASVSRYLLEVYRGQVRVHSAFVTGVTSTPEISLDLGQEHSFRVRAVDGQDKPIGFWSDLRAFTILLAVPAFTRPASTTNTRTPTYEWSQIEYAPKYQLEVKEKSTGRIVSAELTNSTSITPTQQLEFGAFYVARLRAVNLDLSAAGEWSAPLEFKV